MTYKFKAGDRVKVLSNKYDHEGSYIRKGDVLWVVEDLPKEDDGYWITRSGVKSTSLNYFTWLHKDFELISDKAEDPKEVITHCRRNPETGNLMFDDLSEDPKEEYTGSSVDYYKVKVDKPTTQESPYSAEANDIIEALGLTFAEGNLLKAVWRIAADRKGLKKKGNNSVYDAEKLVFFANRVLVQEKAK